MEEGQVQVRFTTKQPKYAIADTPFSIPAKIGIEDLSKLVNELLVENHGDEWTTVEFDFLVEEEFLRQPLLQHLQSKDISTESTINIEYVERFPAPEPEDSLNHDDWVSAVHCHKDWILTGCYDNTIHLWSVDGTHKLTIPGHSGPVKGVKWIEVNESRATFASVSDDQTVMLWKLDLSTPAAECIYVGRGHERTINCVDVDQNASFLVTGGWDTMLKIWGATIEEPQTNGGTENEPKNSKAVTKTPLMTLPGHKEAISDAVYNDNNEIFSASMDHTIKLWDAEIGGLKSEIAGNKSFSSLSWSQLNRTIITSSFDRHIRLYDPRSTEGSLVKATFTSHKGWVSSVRWSKTQEHMFISGGHDNMIKLWDSRSPKAPLYDMCGHKDKVLCIDWSKPEVMVSGSADNTLKVFKSTL